jgi:hypothetical protein
MNSKDKAKELVDKFREFADGTCPETDRYSPNIEKQKAKECALIAVAELLSETEERDGMRVINNPYWLEVKQEIELL